MLIEDHPNSTYTISNGFVKTCTAPSAISHDNRSLGTHHLTTTRRPPRDDFPEGRYPARLRVHRPAANQVVNGKFDGLFWRNTLKKMVNGGCLSQ